MHKTPLLIEQHLHGAYGVDFNKVSNPSEVIDLSLKLLSHGIGGFFPTLVTDSIENLKRQISIIKDAAKECNNILGIHLEGVFLNTEKKGIHNPEHFLPLTVENYKLIEDDFIKIVTLAPELDEGLINYLRQKQVKVQAGHCVSENLDNVDGVTHLFNAMTGISHRAKSTSLSALINDDIYTEIISDGVHVSDDILRLVFKSKPLDKIILISDALPITYSDAKEAIFADSKIYYDGKKATDVSGTLAGSTVLLDEIIKRMATLNLFNPVLIENTYKYHNIDFKGEIIWDDNWNILSVSQNV